MAGLRLFENKVRQCVLHDLCRIAVREDPGVDFILGKHDRHTVMDEGECLGGFARKNGKAGEVSFHSVKPGKPDNVVTHGLNDIFIPCLAGPVRAFLMFPLKIIGAGDDAATAVPAVFEHWLLRGCL